MKDEASKDRDRKIKDEIMKYWFLLEKELIQAINKGNMALATTATTRIKFLLRVIDD